jgi:hypothetical protein
MRALSSYRQKQRINGKKGGERSVAARKSSSGSSSGSSDAQASKVKERKERKESTEEEGKGENSPDVPSLENVINYFLENGYVRAAAIKFFEMYDKLGWADTKGNQIKNWKMKAQKVWFTPEHKFIEAPKVNTPTFTPFTGFKAHGE